MGDPDLFNIYWIDLRPIKGHEQDFYRPGLVFAKHLTGLATIIPLTSSKEALQYPFTQLVQKSAINLLSKDSVALIFHMRSVDFKKRNRGSLGKIDGIALDLIISQVKLYLMLP